MTGKAIGKVIGIVWCAILFVIFRKRKIPLVLIVITLVLLLLLSL